MKKLKGSSFGFGYFENQRKAVIWGAMAVLLTTLSQALGQPTIVSSVPATGTTGISSTASVVFTFSTAMDTNRTTAQFYTSIPTPPYSYIYAMSNSWNAASNVLTCSPVSAFMVPTQVVWTVTGFDPSGSRLQGTKVGYFFTSETVGSGSGTNEFTTFLIGRADLYSQAGIAQPTPNVVEPYIYLATITLASNRTTTGISLTFPGGGVSNLVQNPGAPENWTFGGYMTNEAILETNFPPGNYAITVHATASNETKVVSFPASLVQPSAPHLTNPGAAQAVDSTQPFTLQWDPFPGGTAADYIVAGLTTNWQSPNIGSPGVLHGAATSVTIPGGTLAPGTTYSASVGFSHAILATNGTEATYVYRATVTQFVLTTKQATVTAAPVVTNAGWNGGVFGFDLLTTSGQTVTVVSSTNAATPLASWPILLTTNPPGTRIHISDPRSGTNAILFYRARNGN
ncbi:MAG TPA: Ig-like domain-containing protein [Candidatus Limnocylindrales bacterium]|nr:Ig-like domain-containing protein [Candidatus Limnocylindrales bacterium]